MESPKVVLYDFDGVILDSSRVGLKNIKKIVAREGIEIPSDIRDRAKKYWGLPGAELTEKLFDLTKKDAEELYKKWEEQEEQHMLPLVENAFNTLSMISEYFGKVCGIVTARNRDNLMKVVDHYGIKKFFYEIQTREDSLFHKPDPRVFDPILKKLEPFGIAKENCIFIGDTIGDMKAARGAGIEFFASAGTSLTPKEQFSDEGLDEDHMLHSIVELPVVIFGRERDQLVREKQFLIEAFVKELQCCEEQYS
ncbi:MAG: HAD-IA family hydrolase [Parcubacteria group bacterium]|nr:HAD-IA family hydrolase [Parcubacteria group bacterium]